VQVYIVPSAALAIPVCVNGVHAVHISTDQSTWVSTVVLWRENGKRWTTITAAGLVTTYVSFISSCSYHHDACWVLFTDHFTFIHSLHWCCWLDAMKESMIF